MRDGERWGFDRNGVYKPVAFRHLPVVGTVLLTTIVLFVARFLFGPVKGFIAQWLVFETGDGTLGWLLKPWTWVTHGMIVGGGAVELLLTGYFLYVVGGVLERSWGSRNLAVLFAAFTAITVLAMVPMAYLFQQPMVMMGLWIPVTNLLVAWAAMDPDQELNVYGIIPVRIKWLALFDVLIIYFNFGFQHGPFGPIIALATLAGPAAAIYYVRKMPRLNLGFRAASYRREPLLRDEPRRREPTGREREDVKRGGFNPLRKRQEQQEIERLRKLLGDDDDRPLSRH